MIKVKNLVKEFEGRVVLNDITATFKQGSVNMIIGKSGSGKTVFLKCLIGLVHPDAGEIRYSGKNIIGMKSKDLKRLRRDMGMLFQGSALFDSKTVLENVMFPLDMFSRKNKRERRKRAEFCLERVNLSQAADLYPSEISGGMMKRVAIARAIALNPKYLFCDEPNSGLDPKTSQLIDELILDITTDFSMTTVVVSHDMNSVMNIGDNILFLNEGVKEWEGNKTEIMGSDNSKLNDFVFASDLFKKIKEAEEIISDNDDEEKAD
ncbi:ABC transporter ATP-binding protein [Limibacterium fermenti]|uniref:ABC transporter ATP-binding protein n=1 Tax=Limibacterium fermenti TaxID=3229863 RepID=UPI000E918AF9|nr:ABC transporter ATP-binding protein [Porphyromonadaceae bacterium]HBX44941.1 ABC transporter ATP-binding protein [Porphyromonadaceae bacterium]